MYHWMLILKNSTQHSSPAQLIANNDSQLREQVNAKVKKQWFWMGLIETLPTATGFLLSEVIDSIAFTYDYLIAGIFISLIVIRIFKNRVLHPPIHIQSKNNSTFNFYTPPTH